MREVTFGAARGGARVAAGAERVTTPYAGFGVPFVVAPQSSVVASRAARG